MAILTNGQYQFCIKVSCSQTSCPYHQNHMMDIKEMPFVGVISNRTKEYKECHYGKKDERRR